MHRKSRGSHRTAVAKLDGMLKDDPNASNNNILQTILMKLYMPIHRFLPIQILLFLTLESYRFIL